MALYSQVRAECEICEATEEYYGSVAPDGSIQVPEGWFAAAAMECVYLYCPECRSGAREDVHAKLAAKGYQFSGFDEHAVAADDPEKLN